MIPQIESKKTGSTCVYDAHATLKLDYILNTDFWWALDSLLCIAEIPSPRHNYAAASLFAFDMEAQAHVWNNLANSL